MKKFIIIILFSMPLSVYTQLYVNPPEFIDNIEEKSFEYVENTHLSLSNLLNESIQNTNLKYTIKPFIYHIEDSIFVKIKIYTNNAFFEEDEVYARRKITQGKWEKTILKLSERIKSLLKEEKLEPYISFEDIERKKILQSLSDEEVEKFIMEEGQKINYIQYFSLLEAGYFYPLNIRIDILRFFSTFKIFEYFSLGFGVKLLEIYPFFIDSTNTSTSLLPLELQIPIFVNKKNKYSDIIFSVSWSWYNPGITNINTTNTATKNNTGSLNFISTSLTYYLPYFYLECGMQYHYILNNFYFYIGANFYIGKYRKE